MQEGGRLAEVEEGELEEGEARLDEEDSFDPDVAFSYIDEKLQHLLGHLQKDFHRGISADNLGPKFGGYGSFLGTYQHFPSLLPQTRSSHVASNTISTILPKKPSAERTDRNHSTVAVESNSRNNGSIPPPTSDLCKKEGCTSTNSEESFADSDSLDCSFNGTESKSPEIQVKVDSKDLLPRKNAAVYCDLGLDMSSSSSKEESSDGLGGLSPEFSNVLCDSPRTILQVMTCFQVPGGFVLSPLRDNILQLTSKFAPLLKKWEAHFGMENVPSNEDQITNVPDALYITPVPAIGSPRDAVEDIATLRAQNGQLEQSRKRKAAPSDGNSPPERSYYTTMETPRVSNQKGPNKQKRTVVDENNNFNRDSLSKHDLRPIRKSVGLVSEKQKSKHTSCSSYLEGVLKERTMVQSKLNTNRGIDQDIKETYKKPRKEDQHQIKRVRDCECDLAHCEDAGEPKAFPAKAKAAKGLLETGDISLRKAKTVNGSRVEVCDLDNGQQAETIEESQAAEQPIFHSSIGTQQKSNSRIPNHETQKPPQDVHIPIKQRKQEVRSTSVKFDVPQMETVSRRSNVENGLQHATVRQAVTRPSGVNPIRKDGDMVAFALKEARDLKHKANHWKNKGLELESTGLYFEAALKFLHVAFLLEAPSLDSSRPADATQSMKIYSETAKLCKFCAHEYERSKKMSAAALAYKCVEVAYLKAAYYKTPSASKDWEELQAVVQLTPGIDNINGHGLSKVPSTKDGCSLQVAGNPLTLAVHNQTHLLRLLAYTNDVNGAFHATRKSQAALVSAAENQEKKGVDDGLASVKAVLDFNFNSNVNELLRLVRLSMESISL